MAMDSLANSLAWADPLLVPLFTLLQSPVTLLELIAFVLSLWMVGCNLRVNVWGWPLAIISSLLYGVLFARGKLYGEASLQLVFVSVSVWGWWQWLRHPSDASDSPAVATLTPRARWYLALVTAGMWPLIGLGLQRYTDSDVPFLDALPTAMSLMGQYLLGRKLVENWPVWLAVNLISMGLFAYKGYWLTLVLYGLFAVLSVWGWRQWLAMMERNLP